MQPASTPVKRTALGRFRHEGAIVNVQHPGNGNPLLAGFPAPSDGVTVPGDAAVVITRKDGGIVGS